MKQHLLLFILAFGALNAGVLKVPKAGTKELVLFKQKLLGIAPEQYQSFFPVGKRVLAKYPGKMIPVVGGLKDEIFGKNKYWYQATVTKTDFNPKKCSIYVIYDDGDKSWVPCHFAFPFNPFSEMTKAEKDSFLAKPVLARYYDSGRNIKYWYRATVTRIDPNGYFLVYDDGDTKQHSDMNTVAQATFLFE